MSEKETITVADVSAGPGGAGDAEDGTTVAVPAVELLTGRGFITGKSGSGKSNTASVVIEKLLSKSFPVLIVDTDGEYYGLKEEYELLHAGADEECDIQVSPEHAEKLASLALEQNVPIILDVSSYLDESDANEMVLEVTKHLFAKEKRLKKPFLMLVEECHEYIPEGGGMAEVGKMLIKVGKRGRKHGLGIVGISQRPADVKKDYITQCDWLVWHRLTWNNDTKVVGRILGSEYADAIEDLNDGEAFLMTDWAEDIRRVQFHRKQTFDAGATPGLDDFERPDLKSVSGDLVSDLKNISDEQERRESELADLRQELDKKRQRISELEAELEDARDMSNMADTFAQALLQKAEAPYRQGGRSARTRADEVQEFATDAARSGHPGGRAEPYDYPDPAEGGPTPSPVPDARDDVRARLEDEGEAEADDAEAPERPISDDQSELHDYEDPRAHPAYNEIADEADAETTAGEAAEATDEDGATTDDDGAAVEADSDSPDSAEAEAPSAAENAEADAAVDDTAVDDAAVDDAADDDTAVDDAADDDDAVDDAGADTEAGESEDAEADREAGDKAEPTVRPVKSLDAAGDDTGAEDEVDVDAEDYGITPEAFAEGSGGSLTAPAASVAARRFDAAAATDDGSSPRTPDEAAESVGAAAVADPTGDREGRLSAFAEEVELRDTEAVVRGFARAIEQFDEVTHGMLAYYARVGAASPIDAHVAAGGSGDRHFAYARNRTLRQAGLIEHVARGSYQYCLPDLVAEVFAGGIDGQTLADTVAAVESAAGLVEE